MNNAGIVCGHQRRHQLEHDFAGDLWGQRAGGQFVLKSGGVDQLHDNAQLTLVLQKVEHPGDTGV